MDQGRPPSVSRLDPAFTLRGLGIGLGLFFGKKKRFPRAAIAFMVISVVWVVVDFAVALAIPAVRGLDHTVQIAAIAQGLVGAAIWIPYFMKSKRVHVTFVE